jgi:hypothetical protein
MLACQTNGRAKNLKEAKKLSQTFIRAKKPIYFLLERGKKQNRKCQGYLNSTSAHVSQKKKLNPLPLVSVSEPT